MLFYDEVVSNEIIRIIHVLNTSSKYIDYARTLTMCHFLLQVHEYAIT